MWMMRKKQCDQFGLRFWANWRQLSWSPKKKMEEMKKRAQKPNITGLHDHAKISNDYTNQTRRGVGVAG